MVGPFVKAAKFLKKTPKNSHPIFEQRFDTPLGQAFQLFLATK
jgi:hypothetical protein